MPTVIELRQLCKQKKIKGYSGLTKAELLIKCQQVQVKNKTENQQKTKEKNVENDFYDENWATSEKRRSMIDQIYNIYDKYKEIDSTILHPDNWRNPPQYCYEEELIDSLEWFGDDYETEQQKTKKQQKKFKFVFEFLPLVFIINYNNEDVQPENWEQIYNYGQNLCETVVDWLNAKPDIFKDVTGEYNVRMSERRPNIKTLIFEADSGETVKGMLKYIADEYLEQINKELPMIGRRLYIFPKKIEYDENGNKEKPLTNHTLITRAKEQVKNKTKNDR